MKFNRLAILRWWQQARARLTAAHLPYAGERTRRNWLLIGIALITVAHVFIFMKAFPAGGPDMEKYYYFAKWASEGFAPYRDFAVEYPPGALFIFQIPYYFAQTLEGYGVAFSGEMLVFDLLGMLMVLGLAQRFKLRPLPTLVIYTLSLIAISAIIVQRYDLPPAIVTLGALYAFSRGHYKSAWALLAIGGMIKLYPLLLAPLFLIYQFRHQRWQALVLPVLTFVAVTAAIALPFYQLDHQGFIESFTIQGGRSLQVESSYASALLVGYALGFNPAQVYLGQISYNIDAPLADFFAKWSLYIMGAAVLAVYVFYLLSFRRFKNPRGRGAPPGADMAHLLNYAFVVVLVMMLTNKVLSPQYLAWLYPFVPLITGRFRHAVWTTFFFVGWMTWYIYPAHYYDLINLGQVAIALLFLRNALLFLMVVWLWGEPWRREEEAPALPAPA